MCWASTMTTRSLPWPTCSHPGGASSCRPLRSTPTRRRWTQPTGLPPSLTSPYRRADTPNTWIIDGTEAGTLNGQSFAGVENLTGGASADIFKWMAGGSVSGVVSGGLGNDTLIGADTPNTWTLTGVGAGMLNGQAFAGIENLVGGGER